MVSLPVNKNYFFYEKFCIFRNKFSEIDDSIFLFLRMSLVSCVLKDSWILVPSAAC